MNFLIILACTVAAVFLLHKPIHKAPWLFYLICIALDFALFANVTGTLPTMVQKAIGLLMHKGGLGVALFVVVMYIGVFPRAGAISRMLRPIRAELSIMACILIAGHMCVYLSAYLPRIIAGTGVKTNVLTSFVLAVCLLILVLLLGVTSFRFVKRHMTARSWKKLQTLAYVFYVLIFFHLMLMLGPSALHGGQPALTNVIVYAIVFGVYVIARIWRAVIDKREEVDLAETIKDQGFEE